MSQSRENLMFYISDINHWKFTVFSEQMFVCLWHVTYALQWLGPRPYSRQRVGVIFHSCTMIHVNIEWTKTQFSTHNLSIAFSKAVITEWYPLHCCTVVILQKTFVISWRRCKKKWNYSLTTPCLTICCIIQISCTLKVLIYLIKVPCI